MKHEIEIAMVGSNDRLTGDVAGLLNRIQTEWDAANENFPIPDQDIFKQVFDEFGGREGFSHVPGQGSLTFRKEERIHATAKEEQEPDY